MTRYFDYQSDKWIAFEKTVCSVIWDSVVSLPALQALAVSFAPEAKNGNSRSVSGRQRLKIVGKAISCPGPGTATSRPWSNVMRVT
jgi:hypothetical protein